MNEYGLERLFGVPQLFIKRETTGIILIISKATDYFLLSVRLEYIRDLMRKLSKAFKVWKFSIGGTFRFMDLEINVGDEMVDVSMWDYLDKKWKLFLRIGDTSEIHWQRGRKQQNVAPWREY